MIIRVVQMTFRVEAIPAFEELFAARKEHIRHFEGCQHLELWQDANDPRIFFTYSHWLSEKHLDHYRFSSFFKETWGMTKALFDAPPQAWSVNSHTVVA
jgi:heme-degrading monooxygenase HmoA